MYKENKTSRQSVQKGRYQRHIRTIIIGIGAMIAHQQADAAVPSLDATFLGGTPTAVNNVGQVVGHTNVDGIDQAWLYTPGVGMTYLPTPSGWSSHAKDISDTGIIVGSVDDGISQNAADGATVWNLSPNGYVMTILDLPPNTDYGSSANGVNSQGDIIGTRTYLTEWTPGRWTTVTRPFVITWDGNYIADLTTYPTLTMQQFTAEAKDINDNRQIVGGSLRMDLDLNVVENLATATTTNGTTINGIYSNSINESGQVAAMGYNSQGYFAMHYTDGLGWTALTIPMSVNTTAYAINDNGDVLFNLDIACGGSNLPAVYLAAENTVVCVQQMLSNQNWQVAARVGAGLANNRNLAVIAQNLLTTEFGAVSLAANGNLPPPLAPTNLVATPHAATYQQPFIAIDLTWTDNSDNESAFRIERRPSGVDPWAVIGKVNANVTGFRDSAIDPLATYDYRVIAVGPGGDSTAAMVTVTAPNAVDATAPTVTIVSPSNGATVTGDFTISTTVTDNVAVTSVVMEMQLNGTLVNICNLVEPATATVACNVNSKKYKLQNGTVLPITVRAYDAMLNSASASISVTWGSSSGGGKGGGRR